MSFPLLCRTLTGHGRNGANAYRSANRIVVRHATLTAGDTCPACGEGIVYEKAPGVLVRITGQPPLVTKIYTCQLNQADPFDNLTQLQRQSG